MRSPGTLGGPSAVAVFGGAIAVAALYGAYRLGAYRARPLRTARTARTALDSRVREAGPGDADVIVAFTKAMAIETENTTLDDARVRHGVEAPFNGQVTLRPRYWVMEGDEVDGRPRPLVGMVGISPEWSDWWGSEYWWIHAVYVHSDYRRRGVGKVLLRTALACAEAAGVQTVNLRVEKNNAKAQKLYHSAGFAVDNSHLVMSCGKTPSGENIGAGYPAPSAVA